MNNTNIATSLDNTEELRKLILDNPDLPLIIFAGEESYIGEYSHNSTEVSSVSVKELTLHEEFYLDKEDFEDKLLDKYEDKFETDKELDDYVAKIIKETEFVKVIVVYVG